jgi:predicted transcriptional regulator
MLKKMTLMFLLVICSLFSSARALELRRLHGEWRLLPSAHLVDITNSSSAVLLRMQMNMHQSLNITATWRLVRQHHS